MNRCISLNLSYLSKSIKAYRNILRIRFQIRKVEYVFLYAQLLFLISYIQENPKYLNQFELQIIKLSNQIIDKYLSFFHLY